jgi:hypothetical protein
MKNLIILFLIFLIFSCSASFKMEEKDKIFLMDFTDIVTNNNFKNYKVLIENEKNYWKSYKISIFDKLTLNYFYVIFKDNTNDQILISTMIIKNKNLNELNKTFDSNKNKNILKYIKKINFEDFKCLDGYFIDSPTYKSISLKRKYFIYDLSFLSSINIPEINLINYKEKIINKLDNFERLYK